MGVDQRNHLFAPGLSPGWVTSAAAAPRGATLETTQGQSDGFFSQLLFKSYLPEEASVGD